MRPVPRGPDLLTSLPEGLLMDPAQLDAMARQADAVLASQTTDTQLQAAIAASRPELWAALASNPSTYPDLLAWLDGLQDPQVGAALAARAAGWQQSVQPGQVAPVIQPGQAAPSAWGAGAVPQPSAAPGPASGAWGATAPVGTAPTGASAPVAASAPLAAASAPLPPPARQGAGRDRRRGPLAALLVLALVGGGAWWVARGGAGGGTTSAGAAASGTSVASAAASPGPSASAGDSASTVPSGQVTVCDKDAGLRPTAVSGDAVSLTVTVKVAATCAAGDLLSGSGGSVIVYAPSSTDGSGKNDAVVALGSLDLSKDPVVVPGSGAQLTITFKEGQYFRMAEDLSVSHLEVRARLDRTTGEKSAKMTDARGSVSVTAGAADAKAAEDAAAAALTWHAARDKSTAVSDLNGKWVPQISSKKPGLEADGRTYDNRSTLQDFFSSRAAYPDALLLSSDEWSVFDAGGHWWVTVIKDPSTDAIFANSWCDSHGIPKDGCYAKYLDPNGTPKGSTRLRD